MKKLCIRSLCLLLCAAMLCLPLVSCANTAGNEKGQDSQTTEKAAVESAAPETVPEKILPNIPAAYDFNNYEFVILSVGDGAGYWKCLDFDAPEINGEVVNDARHNTMLAIEEAYKVKIVNRYCKGLKNDEMLMTVTKDHSAGVNDFAMMLGNLLDLPSMAQRGYLYDLYDLPNIDLSKPWYDQKEIKELTIRDRLFFVTGELSTKVCETTFAVLFSKTLQKNLGLENPHDLVRSGKWTYDKMTEMAAGQYSDLNGNDSADKDDRYGMVLSDDSINCAVSGGLQHIAVVDKTGDLTLTFENEKMYSILDKYFAFVYTQPVFHYQRLTSGSEDAKFQMFTQDRALFNITYLYTLPQLRNMESDFGILPNPKFSEDQEEYGSFVHGWGCAAFAVPSNSDNPERAGMILEALSAKAMDTIKPAYYDISLNGRIVRDSESSDMLDIIFATRVYDVGLIFQVSGFKDSLLNLVRNKMDAYASIYAKLKTRLQTDVDKINNTFAALGTNQ